jgi:hypothetical protein
VDYQVSLLTFQRTNIFIQTNIPSSSVIVQDIDIQDWKNHTAYKGEFAEKGADHPVIQWFWQALEEASVEDRARFLQFSTGTSRVPVQGFSALQGNDGNVKLFTIESIPLEQSVFPRAHTCFNRVDLPLYPTKEDMICRCLSP